MLAMLVDPHGQDPRLSLREVVEPQIRDTEVLVRTSASGVNRADLLQRAGSYSQPALARGLSYTIAGMEVAGEVVAVGPKADGVSVGDRVMGMCGGAFAEFAPIDARLALRIPDPLSAAQAASLPVAAMTAYDALALTGKLRRRDTVLVTAATSAVGTVAVQLAKLFGARIVVATTRSESRRTQLLDLGADQVLITTPDGNDDPLAGSGVRPDLVIDHVGAALFPSLVSALEPGGRYVSVGRIGGRSSELDLNQLALKRLSLHGTTFRSRSLRQYISIARGVQRHVVPLVAEGSLRAVTGPQFPLEQANEALDSLRSPHRRGKVIVTPQERP